MSSERSAGLIVSFFWLETEGLSTYKSSCSWWKLNIVHTFESQAPSVLTEVTQQVNSSALLIGICSLNQERAKTRISFQHCGQNAFLGSVRQCKANAGRVSVPFSITQEKLLWKLCTLPTETGCEVGIFEHNQKIYIHSNSIVEWNSRPHSLQKLTTG